MFDVSSSVKTLAKNSFRVSAFSCALDDLDPSFLIKVGIVCLVFSLDFVYFQKTFGFVLA